MFDAFSRPDGSVVYPLPAMAERLVWLHDATNAGTKKERRPFEAAFLNLF